MAAHLSFLITFHRADSLSQTVVVISWQRGETWHVRNAHWATPPPHPRQTPWARNIILHLTLFGPSRLLGLEPILPDARTAFLPDTLARAEAETWQIVPPVNADSFWWLMAWLWSGFTHIEFTSQRVRNFAMSHTPRHFEGFYYLQRKKEGKIPAKAMSCKINTSDQCFINKKMSYFTFLCGPLSPGCMMECQIILWSSTFGRIIECTCKASWVAYKTHRQLTLEDNGDQLLWRALSEAAPSFLLGNPGLLCSPALRRPGWR